VLWERLLQGGVAARAVRPEVDVAFAARTVLVALQSLLQPANLERFEAAPHEVVGSFFNLIFTGLLTAEGRSDYENHRAIFAQPLPLR
jgi:hypothetical protein